MVIAHLPRQAEKTVFVLGGGGNLGALQVGMLRAVLERGWRPDLILGCSVGALHAAALAADPTVEGLARMEQIWLDLRHDELFPPGRLSGVRLLTRRGPSMVPAEGLERLIRDSLGFRCFEEASVPFEVNATSMRTGAERWFSEGEVLRPIMASAALPGVFPPVEIGGEAFIDGGVVNNVPISRALAAGATRLVVFHVGNFERSRPAPKRPIDVLLQSFSIARSHRFLMDMASIPGEVEAVVLPAPDPGRLRYNDFGRSRLLMERGHHAAARFLDTRPAAVGA